MLTSLKVKPLKNCLEWLKSKHIHNTQGWCKLLLLISFSFFIQNIPRKHDYSLFHLTSKQIRFAQTKTFSRFNIKIAFRCRNVWLSEVSCDSVDLQQIFQDLVMKEEREIMWFCQLQKQVQQLHEVQLSNSKNWSLRTKLRNYTDFTSLFDCFSNKITQLEP